MTQPQATQKKNSSAQAIFSTLPFFGAFSLSQLTSYPYSFLAVLIPFLAIEGVLIVFYLNKLKKTKQTAAEMSFSAKNPAATKLKTKSLLVDNYEISNEFLKFSVMKGFTKKRKVTLKEIPVFDITGVEVLGNELSVSSKNATDWFIIKKKGASLSGLREQILGLLEEHKKNLEFNEKAAQRKTDLEALLAYSVGIVDVSFDVLMGLQVKPVNWEKQEIYADSLKEKTECTPKSLSPLSLDFSKVTEAVKGERPEEASKETFNVLKTIFAYFAGLSPDEDIELAHPNFKDAKTAISAYYTLNDLLLGRIVGEKDDTPETDALETSLATLASETAFKADFQNLVANIQKITAEVESESIIEESREILKEQLYNLDRPNEQPIVMETLNEPVSAEPEATLPVPQETPLPQPSEPIPLPEPTEPTPPIIDSNVVPQRVSEPLAIKEENETMPKREDLITPPTPVDLTNESELIKQDAALPPETQAVKEPSPELSATEQQETPPSIAEQPKAPKEDVPATVVESSLVGQVPISNPPLVEESKLAIDTTKKKSLGRRLRKSIMGY